MGKYSYPSVPAPTSQPTATPSQAELERRGFSWMPEPRNGALRSDSSAPPVPALPAQPQVQPQLQLQSHAQSQSSPQQPQPTPHQTTYVLTNQTTQARYTTFPPPDRQQTLSVSTFRTGTPVPEYTRDGPEEQHNTALLTVEPNNGLNARTLQMSTRSMKAPEVVINEPLPPLPETVHLEPDSSPLTPSHSSPSSQVPIMPNAAFLPATPLQPDFGSEQGGTWRHSLCSCADTPTCLTSIFCPCVIYGKTQYRLDARSANKDPTNMLGYHSVNGSCAAFGLLFCGCNFILAAIQRTRIRRAYNMSNEAGNVGTDCAQALCCCCCTLAQDEKEMKAREGGTKKDGDGVRPQGYRMQVPMSYTASTG